MLSKQFTQTYAFLIPVILSGFILYGCSTASGDNHQQTGGPPPAPVIELDTTTTTTQKEYTAALEGKVHIEIRAQVEGYLDAIFVDEGAYVNAGQSLFKINDLPYQEQLNTALANQHAAEASLYAAEIEVNKLTLLVKNNVVSDVQLKTAESNYQVAKANLEQTKSAVAMARINLGYTLVKAPVSGYIGRIPKKIGSLVGRMDQQALTVLSDVKDVYAYFSMSEVDFILFNRENKGTTMPEKISELLPVTLILADGTIYEHEGRIEMIDGQFDKTTGSISVRASFPNPNGFLRSGNTGKVQMRRLFRGVILVPQQSTMEMQDKVFVYAIGDSSKVQKQPIVVLGISGNNYLVQEGVKPGDKIVYNGLDHLQEGAVVHPEIVQQDSIQ